MRRVFAIALVSILAACAGDVTSPAPSTPLAGTYQVTASFKGVPTNMAGTTGTITFAPASATDSTVIASANLTVNVNGSVMTFTQITDLHMTSSGGLTFHVSTLNPDATWTWNGQRASDTKIQGTNTLGSPGVDPSPGSFTMVKVDRQ